MWAINIYTLSYHLLLVSTIPGPAAAALVPSIAVEIQSNQSLSLETPRPANVLFAPNIPTKPPLPPLPPGPTKRLLCLGQSQEGGLPPNVEDCELVLEYILHKYPPGPMILQNFSRTGADGTIRFPAVFQVKNCQIMISSRRFDPNTWDMIRYVDVIAGAKEVLNVCVPTSKFGLGGMAILTDKGSYVAVNGFKAGVMGSVSEDGNGTNATSMATGTAVEIPLLTGVSGLAQGDDLMRTAN